MEAKVGESDETLSLKARVEALPYEEIKPDLRARLSVEMVKDAVNAGNVTPEAAQGYATSLIQDCSVPVVIGTSEVKVYPIESIIQSRPFVVANLKDAANKQGIDYEKVSDMRRHKAEDAVLVLEQEFARQNQKYDSFAQYLSFEQRTGEMGLQAERMAATRQVLQGGVSDGVKTDDESVSLFMQTDVANVYFGQELQSWLNSR
jgi:hypothetical protein